MALYFERTAHLSGDLTRVKRLPRRTHTPEAAAQIAADLTANLGKGGMQLNAVQGVALYELGETGGLFGALGVGAGKTLASLLAPAVLHSKRPLLVIPAALRTKTEAERFKLSKHWPVAMHMRIVSYEEMGRVSAATLLETYRPDLIIFDECHRVKNRKAGVTRRFTRYLSANQDVAVVAMSGTVIKKSIKDFAHMLRWALKDKAPVPLTQEETDEWAAVLDHKTLAAVAPGRLLELYTGPRLVDETAEAREGFRSRLVETPGVVCYDAPGCNASLRIEGLEFDVSQVTVDNFRRLRTDWETPTGWTISEAIVFWGIARQIALGLHYEWVTPGPVEWLAARKAWARFCRTVLSHSRTYDTELQVVNAVLGGHLSAPELARWRELKPTFTPIPQPIWHDDSALETCETWMHAGPGIVFCGHDFFGRALAKRTGAPYYGAGGLCGDVTIETEDGRRPIIASLAANGTGRNLQSFHRALVTSVPAGPDALEQLIGRMHRQGQEADEVCYTILFGCTEHVASFWKAFDGAKAIEQLTGARMKVTSQADIVDVPTVQDAAGRQGYQWA